MKISNEKFLVSNRLLYMIKINVEKLNYVFLYKRKISNDNRYYSRPYAIGRRLLKHIEDAAPFINYTEAARVCKEAEKFK